MTEESPITLHCSDGIQMCGKRWRRRASPPPTTSSNVTRVFHSCRILCLHGFLDNCESHHILAPYLAENLIKYSSVDLVAFDFPGHGLSSHKSRDADGVVSDYCFYVAEAVRLLGWVGDHNRYRDKFILIGHSMGGAVATMYASTFPDQIHALITLDAFGPDFEPPKNISSRIRRHLLDRYEHNVKRNENNGSSAIKQYDTLQVAAQARMRTATLAPGRHQYLSQEAATKMVQRATIAAQNGDKIQFIHDQRLKHSPIFLHSPDQLEGVWKSIQCPMYCLVAKDGWPFPSGILQRAYSHVQQTGHLTVDTLTGSHHFHADPETAMAVAKAIATYIEKQGL